MLIEREAELARVDAVLAAARSGTGATLLIEGPAGIGKTTLLSHAIDRASGSGMTVLRARGSQLERDHAMGVLRQCLVPAVRSADDPDALLAGAAGLARSVVLDLPDAAGETGVGVLHGLYWLIANLADSGPLVLAVDDAHWADEASLLVLAYLARRVQSLPLAVVICTRAEERAMGEALAEVRVDAGTQLLAPAPLAAVGVKALLAGVGEGEVSTRFAQACHDATGGNPFLLGELARALLADGMAFTDAEAARVTGIAPPTVARSVRVTLARLGAAAAGVARSTAILGDDVGLDLVAEHAELGMPEATAAAGELVAAGLLDDATPLRFRHPILTGAVAADLSAPERAAAHARAAAILRERGADPDHVAIQLMHAAPAGDPDVVTELRHAAERARSRGAPGTAVTLLRRALAEPPPAEDRGDLLLELGGVEYAAGETETAAVHLEETLRCASDPVVRGQALLTLSQAVPYDQGRRKTLGPLVRATLAEVEGLDRELALRLRTVGILSSEPGPELDAAVAACRDLEGATPGEAIALAYQIMPRMGAGAPADEIAELAERAARQADVLLEEGATAVVLIGVVLGLRWSERLESCERLLDRAIAIARARGSTVDFAIAKTHRAATVRRAGRLLDAEADARESLAAGMDRGWSFAGPPGIIPLIASLVDQGRIDEARQELASSYGEDSAISDEPAMQPLLLERMRLRAALGDHAGAISDWEEAVRRAERLFGINPGWIEDLGAASDAYRAAGQHEKAGELADKALEVARGWGTPGAIGQALHTRARARGSEGAIPTLREAVEQLRESPLRLELARALVGLGGALRRDGQRVESREPLREGFALAQSCGAAALAETARSELNASGVRLRRESLSGAASLTASERRIAELAAEGSTNAEIAQGLFLTVKTVEMHLTHAYRKLDISGRAKLAGALET